MGFLNKLFGKEQGKTIFAPLAGNAIPMEKIPDPVFSQGVLGPGCGIEPSQSTVYAPFDGEITQVAETKHAIGICSQDGMELLIHVGIDTVSMNGDGFTPAVTVGQKVQRGQKLLDFQIDKIQAAGFSTTTAVILCNADDIGQPTLVSSGMVNPSDILMEVK